MSKKICEKDNPKKDKVEHKKFTCKKCGLKSNKEGKLCKPVEK
jgi:hypothetical protein